MSLSSPDILDVPTAADAPPADVRRLTIVVPCYNEAESVIKLAAGLRRLRLALTSQYQTEILLIDDGSSDGTWSLLHDYLGNDPSIRILRHETNRGIAAAIGTGLSNATADLVASIDADCTYDPLQLKRLLDLMTDDVDMVVASPYHPAGAVKGVASWRLTLSRAASRLYSLVLRNKLHTYTSCFRVYRKSSVVDLPRSRDGFVGVVELLWQLDRRGGRIVECPAVLEVRTTGQSKMRLARTTLAHLALLAQAAWQQLRGPAPVWLHRNNTASVAGPTNSSTFAPRTT